MKLSATQIRNAKAQAKTVMLSDGEGLNLRITASDSRSWIFRYQHPITKKAKQISLGVYPDLSLAAARELKREARALVAAGIDPLEHRDREKLLAREEIANTFEQVANEWFDMWKEGKATNTINKCTVRIDKHIMPTFRARPIASITRRDIINLLRPIQKEGHFETLMRIRNILQRIMQYAIRAEYIADNPTTDLDGVFPSPKSKRSHMAALIDPVGIGKYLVKASHYQGYISQRIAMQLAPLLFLRPGELRQLRWEYIDFQKQIIELPAEIMKTREAHIVPLPWQAQVLIEELYLHTGEYDWLFPSPRSTRKPIGDMALTTALKRMGYAGQLTMHGWRATARTLLEETLEYPAHLIEHQLGHQVKDALGRAYNRTKHIDKRTLMMQAYADHLDTLRGQKIQKPTKTGKVLIGSFGRKDTGQQFG